MKIQRKYSFGFVSLAIVFYASSAFAQTPPADGSSVQDTADSTLPAAQARVSGKAPTNQVVVTGVVPNQATKAAALAKLREVYGTDKVIDEVTVGDVVAPPNWTTYVERMLVPGLKNVSRGKLVINGNAVAITGDVLNEAQRQQVVSDMANQLNPSYSINNSLAIGSSKQQILDDALADRTIEFLSGSARLTGNGQKIIDEMTDPIRALSDKTVEIIGHTDNRGKRSNNVALSAARADTVKAYLVNKGIPDEKLITLGAGEQRPIASNETPDGRARNRRIEFRIRGPE